MRSSSGEECLAQLEARSLPSRTARHLAARAMDWQARSDSGDRRSRRPVVVVISGHGTIETAVRATKLGAFDFLEKPLSIEKVTVVVKNALEHRRLQIENERLARK